MHVLSCAQSSSYLHGVLVALNRSKEKAVLCAQTTTTRQDWERDRRELHVIFKEK